MTRSSRRPTRRVERAARVLMTLLALLASLASLATAMASPSWGYWNATGSASGAASTGVLSAPTGVTVPAAAAPDVPVSWTAGLGGVTPARYVVTRHTGTLISAACGTSAALPTAATACTDSAVPDGTFTYVVTAVYASWTRASSPSGPVTVRNATAVAFVAQPTDTIVDATVTPAVTVALRTADGQAFSSAGVPVTLAIGSNPGGGALHGTLTVNTDAAGVATFDNLSVSSTGVGYTLTASSASLTGDVSATFTVTVPPLLGAAQSFSLLAFTAVVNNGVSTVSGDVGVSPGSSVTGFSSGTVGGDIHVADAAAAAAQSALISAYNDLSSRPPDAQIAGELSGLTFLPGIYHSTAALGLTTSATLDAGGDPNAVFVFQTDGAFNTAAHSSLDLINGARAANIYWVAAGAVGTGDTTALSGNILSLGAVTLGANTTLIGRALSRGTVTLTGSTVRFTDSLPPTITISGGGSATTKDTTPTIGGSSNAASGSTITVTVAGQSLPTTVGLDGTWSVTAAAMVAGSYPVVAKVRDADGNGAAAAQTLTVEVNPAPVALGTAGGYAVLAGTSVTNTDSTVVNGDLGVSPGDVTGFPPGIVNGTSHVGDSAAAGAEADLAAAIIDASGRPPHTEIVGDLGGQTFHIGVHHSTAALSLTGNVTLDAEGNANAVFIFQTDAAFNTAAGSTVTLANGAQAANVYWMVAGAAGTGANTQLSGTVLCSGAITLGAGTQLAGRALARGAVTLAGNSVTMPGFAHAARRAARASTTGSPPPAIVASTARSTPATTDSTAPTTKTGAPVTTTVSGAPTTSSSSASTTPDTRASTTPDTPATLVTATTPDTPATTTTPDSPATTTTPPATTASVTGATTP